MADSLKRKRVYICALCSFEVSHYISKCPMCESLQSPSSQTSNADVATAPPSPTLTKDDFTPLENESPVIQAEVIEKWLSLSDPTASVTIRRFQTLVAARLHARVQESSVRVAMKNLIISEGVHFDVQTFATIEEDTLTELVQNIHFWRR